MNKIYILLKLCLILFAGLLTGCESTDTSDPVADSISEFYTSNYSYKQTYILNGDVTAIVEGKLNDSPYKEYQKITFQKEEYDNDMPWTEAYYSGKGKIVTAILNTKDGWTKVSAGRVYPYGHGEDLQYTFDRKETLRGIETSVYKAQYSVDFGFKEPVSATIGLEYYIADNDNTLLQIKTDLSDLAQKTRLSNLMTTENCSREEAEKMLQEGEGLPDFPKEKFEIYEIYPAEKVDIEIPDIP